MDEDTKQFIRDFFKGAHAWGKPVRVLVDTQDGDTCVTLSAAYIGFDFILPPDWKPPVKKEGE